MGLITPFSVPMSGPMALDANGIASSQAFLISELEKRNQKINEPLMSVTWTRDIVAETGGGWIETTSSIFAEYATTGANEWGLINNETNNIPLIQANLSKDVYRVHKWANSIKVPFLDQQFMASAQVGRSLDELLYKGLQINYQKALDQNVYYGFPSAGTTGLVNDPNVASSLAPLNAGGTSRLWINKTPSEILRDINTLLTNTWANSEYDLEGMANQILVPPTIFGYLNTTLISSAGNQSIMKYLMENNIAVAQGRNFIIAPCRQCIGAGASGTDRLVAYVNNEDRVSFDLPIPLQRVMTESNANQLAYISPYVALIGQVKFKYFQTAQYMDGV
jgi:hypothetical protein